MYLSTDDDEVLDEKYASNETKGPAQLPTVIQAYIQSDTRAGEQVDFLNTAMGRETVKRALDRDIAPLSSRASDEMADTGR